MSNEKIEDLELPCRCAAPGTTTLHHWVPSEMKPFWSCSVCADGIDLDQALGRIAYFTKDPKDRAVLNAVRQELWQLRSKGRVNDGRTRISLEDWIGHGEI